MRTVLVMFDSLNRHKLTPYGCTDTITPNFERLASRTVQFDTCYAGSLPCMPARRELHTGRYNFLHRSWGPIEPYDISAPALLWKNGVHTHLVSDHYHYWQEGGATYHTLYTTWENIRGQEGDAWKGVVCPMTDAEKGLKNVTPAGKWHRHQDRINRRYTADEALHPQTLTFDHGLEFIETNHDKDQWMLQIEAFDPHEPFVSPEKYHEMYPEDYDGYDLDWPAYQAVTESPETVAHVRRRYAALLSMCDHNLGRVLDAFDRYGLWKDTMLIVCTDHGFMLGEHNFWAKGFMPPFEEVVHTPLFIWDPRCGQSGVHRQSLVQTIDIPATIRSYFGIPLPAEMQGHDLLTVMESDEPVRTGALFGWFGRQVCYTDGRYYYVHTPVSGNGPLYEYTLMPTHMARFFTPGELSSMERHDGFSFTQNLPLMRFHAEVPDVSRNPATGCSALYDLKADPHQLAPLDDPALMHACQEAMSRLMMENDAPAEQWQRLGLPLPTNKP